MKRLIVLFFFFSSLLSVAQTKWDGSYAVKFETKKYKHSTTEIKIWKNNDTVSVKYFWSLNAYLKDKWMWENKGYVKEKGGNVIELFVTEHTNSIKKMEEKLLEKLKKMNPAFKINNKNGVLYLECECKKENELETLELIKM